MLQNVRSLSTFSVLPLKKNYIEKIEKTYFWGLKVGISTPNLGNIRKR